MAKGRQNRAGGESIIGNSDFKKGTAVSFLRDMQNGKASKPWPDMREREKQSASQPQPAFYSSVTLQSTSPVRAALPTRHAPPRNSRASQSNQTAPPNIPQLSFSLTSTRRTPHGDFSPPSPHGSLRPRVTPGARGRPALCSGAPRIVPEPDTRSQKSSATQRTPAEPSAFWDFREQRGARGSTPCRRPSRTSSEERAAPSAAPRAHGACAGPY